MLVLTGLDSDRCGNEYQAQPDEPSSAQAGATPVTLDPSTCPFVGRGGLKLRHALDAFGVNPAGLACADFGCNVGGFTDCLLRAGAAKVYAVDTGYGALAWTLRNDPRVVVMERTNALHAEPPGTRVDLVVIDMAWTPQRLCVPAAVRWIRGGGRGEAGRPAQPGLGPGSESVAAHGCIVTLIKPHYEASHGPEKGLLRGGVLDEQSASGVLERVLSEIPSFGARVLGVARSPIVGGGSKKGAHGNIEYFGLLVPSAE